MSFTSPTQGLQIPWDDSSGDKIYVDFSTDPVEVTSDPNNTQSTRSKLVTMISQHNSPYHTIHIWFNQPKGDKTTMVIEEVDGVSAKTDLAL